MNKMLRTETVVTDREVARPTVTKIPDDVKRSANAAIWHRVSELNDLIIKTPKGD